jgi:hypothetical protein
MFSIIITISSSSSSSSSSSNCKWICTRWQWYYNTQNNTYTLKTIHNTNITNTMHTKLQTKFQPNKEPKVE